VTDARNSRIQADLGQGEEQIKTVGEKCRILIAQAQALLRVDANHLLREASDIVKGAYRQVAEGLKGAGASRGKSQMAAVAFADAQATAIRDTLGLPDEQQIAADVTRYAQQVRMYRGPIRQLLEEQDREAEFARRQAEATYNASATDASNDDPGGRRWPDSDLVSTRCRTQVNRARFGATLSRRCDRRAHSREFDGFNRHIFSVAPPSIRTPPARQALHQKTRPPGSRRIPGPDATLRPDGKSRPAGVGRPLAARYSPGSRVLVRCRPTDGHMQRMRSASAIQLPSVGGCRAKSRPFTVKGVTSEVAHYCTLRPMSYRLLIVPFWDDARTEPRSSPEPVPKPSIYCERSQYCPRRFWDVATCLKSINREESDRPLLNQENSLSVQYVAFGGVTPEGQVQLIDAAFAELASRIVLASVRHTTGDVTAGHRSCTLNLARQ
jgi:hypothetical protein